MARKSPRSKGPTPVEAIRHTDTRINIPTAELRDFVVPRTRRSRARCSTRATRRSTRSWCGGARTSRTPSRLEVPAVPIYIQEKIHPRVLVENLRKTAKAGEHEPEQLPLRRLQRPRRLRQRVDFYHVTSSELVEPDDPRRLAPGDDTLAEKEGLKGKVQMIYIDPPYGIKFGSNWQVSHAQARREGRQGSRTRRASRSRSRRSATPGSSASTRTWRTFATGSMVARDLLTESGSCFVQIGDENVHLVRCLMDEVFGSENFVQSDHLREDGGATAQRPRGVADCDLWFARDVKT